MATDNEGIVRELVDRAFSRGDLSAVDELMSPDLVNHEGSFSDDGSGREDLKSVLRLLRAAFPDLRVTIEDTATAGDRTWTRMRYRGHNTGPFMKAPPSGQACDWEGIMISRFAGGRIVEHWGVVDRLTGLRQIGLAPSPAAHA